MPAVKISIGISTYTAGDTTPSVHNLSYLWLENAGATTITNFDDAEEGQIINLLFIDGNTTINRDNTLLSGGANFTGSNGDILVLQKFGNFWYDHSKKLLIWQKHVNWGEKHGWKFSKKQ